MVFGINSASNTVRKCKIARGEAECYLLPDCIASAINSNYHSRPADIYKVNSGDHSIHPAICTIDAATSMR